MKIHKTPQKDRNTITIQCYDEESNLKPVIVRAGENGVTEIDIKNYYSLEDSEVYYNLKAINPEMSLTPAQKRELRSRKEAWARDYAADFKAKYGYEPHPQDLQDAVNQRFQKNWVGSLDSMLEGDEDDEGYGDKSSFLYNIATYDYRDEPSDVERLREIVAGMDERWQYIYQQVLLEKRTNVEVAAELGISEARVRQIIKKIQTRIAEDEILKKIFR